MNRLTTAVGLAAVLLAAGTVSYGWAAPQHETPSLRFVESGFYRITLEVQVGPSGAPAGFEVLWMTKSDYDALGGWPADEYDPRVVSCEFFGTPSLNPSTGTYQLGADGTVQIQVGDLFDETGLNATYGDGLVPGSQFVFRAKVEASPEGSESGFTPDLIAQTQSAECTQGFWKNHEELWPESCTPMLLGSVLYTKTQLLAIYNTPALGNGLIFLAHQLITAKLNLCNGSDPSNVSQDIADADALIDGQVVPPVGGGFIAPGDASALTERLDDWNNGKVSGVVNCPTRSEAKTWGSVRAQYR